MHLTVESLVNLAIILGLFGFVFWLIDRLIPMKEPFKTIVNVVMIVILILVLLRFFGIFV